MSDTAVISDTSIGEELIYDTATVSTILGVQESTLRKYCSLMQKHSYEFNKNTVGHRVFYKKDIEIIKEIVDLKNASSMTLQQAVKTILESDIDDISDVESITNPDYNKLLEEFSNFRNEQMEFNKQLLEQLQKQDNYIKNSIDARDKKLMIAIRDTQETKRQLLEAAAEAAAAEEERRKKKAWWKFWN